MSSAQSSYRQILKATSIFGGVQVFSIIIQVIRSKVVALLLGPTGMGIMGLLTSSIGLIGNLTNFGLNVSAVKDVANAYNTDDDKRIGEVVTILRRLAWITGLLGSLTVLLLSSRLSVLTFGNRSYTMSFVWLSITLLINQLSSGQIVILQGMRQLKLLAKANLLGSFFGLLTTIPMFYFWGIEGVVPSIIVNALCTLLFSFYFIRRIEIEVKKVTRQQTIDEGKGMLRMGFLISLSSLFTLAVSYLIRVYVGRYGGIDQVGLYSAGFAIVNTYVGLVFNAMATDYYPRLSAIAQNNSYCRTAINQQAEIAILVLAPILIAFLVFIKWIIVLLYSSQFIAINTMIYWAVLGICFKSACWSIGFIFLAKSDSKLFFWNEFSVNIYMLLLSLIGYHLLGFSGLGMSFTLSYILYLIQVYFVCRKRYKFTFSKIFLKLFLFQTLLVVVALILVLFDSIELRYIFGGVLFVVSTAFSILELGKRIGVFGNCSEYEAK